MAAQDGERLPKVWDAAFESWIAVYGMAMVEDAIQRVVTDVWNPVTRPADPSIRDVPRYAAVLRSEEAEPGMHDCYMVRGRAKAKYVYIDGHELLDILRNAMRDGISASTMHDTVTNNETYEGCCADLGIGASEFRRMFGSDEPPADKVFIREDQPEWRAWDAYLRQTTGRGAPMNQRFGWFFPSRLPPADKQKRA